jgi:hypothetical protein
MSLLFVIPAGLLIALGVLLYRVPKIRRRKAFERAGTPYCSHCLYDLSGVDLTQTEYCPGCRKRLPRFAERKRETAEERS